MSIHDIVEIILTVALTTAAFLLIPVVFIALLYYYEGPAWSREVDVVGSQYVSADGKTFEWTKGDAVNNGSPRNTRAEAGNSDPESWEAVEYDDQGDFTIVPALSEGPPSPDVEFDVVYNPIETE